VDIFAFFFKNLFYFSEEQEKLRKDFMKSLQESVNGEGDDAFDGKESLILKSQTRATTFPSLSLLFIIFIVIVIIIDHLLSNLPKFNSQISITMLLLIAVAIYSSILLL
tara:strand:+ start:1201 stop:1527 length:327 start_codon:yes stop_codon:yes gene_type:complete